MAQLVSNYDNSKSKIRLLQKYFIFTWSDLIYLDNVSKKKKK